ncbi:BnaC08g41950D [Brassica napus]|uniref:BnaC08g41950D protein n=1 Tax=Brassica napus TaxID=3708 RepID=A0A078HAA6_BRANA|nr:BnaC08g41950D [Brassica napus]
MLAVLKVVASCWCLPSGRPGGCLVACSQAQG